MFSTRKTLKISPQTSDTVNGLSQYNPPDLWDRGSIYGVVLHLLLSRDLRAKPKVPFFTSGTLDFYSQRASATAVHRAVPVSYFMIFGTRIPSVFIARSAEPFSPVVAMRSTAGSATFSSCSPTRTLPNVPKVALAVLTPCCSGAGVFWLQIHVVSAR